MAAWAFFWACWASAALRRASLTLLLSSLCLDCICLFWASSSAFLFCSWVRSSTSASFAAFMLSSISVSFTEMSCMTSLKVRSSYRSFTDWSMATLPPSRSSCIAAIWLLKSSHWSAISCSFRAISFCLAVISCSLTPMLFCTSEIWLLRTPIWLWSTETFSFSSDSRALAAASFFLASFSSVLCCLMDAEILSSLFCSELMLVAALAG